MCQKKSTLKQELEEKNISITKHYEKLKDVVSIIKKKNVATRRD
jgi:hypothetical protein